MRTRNMLISSPDAGIGNSQKITQKASAISLENIGNELVKKFHDVK
jgi:hypothetical protein